MDKKNALELFESMLRIRLAEEEIAKRYVDQEMRCPVHLSIGQEASPVAISKALKSDDYMMSTHRAHAHYLAKGGSLKALISELYGRKNGCAFGQGGSMHLIDLSVNFLGSTSIVGGTIPVGVGTAFTSHLKGENKVSVVCFGDTAVEEGVFHESMNFAALHKLPVLFMCENNGYSCYSPLENRQPKRALTEVARAHAIKSHSLNGNDIYQVYEEIQPILKEIRVGKGPIFVELSTFRQIEHCGPYNDDHLNYRKESEISEGHKNDPLKTAKSKLIEWNYWDESWFKTTKKAFIDEINQAFEQAIQSPYPDISQLGAVTYARSDN